MPQLDFSNPHQRFLRKFPQRSQSLRVKSNSSPSDKRSFSSSTKNGTNRVNPTPMTKLIITNHDLIIQDTLSPSFSLVDSPSESLVKQSGIDDNGLISSSSTPLNFNLDKKSLVGYACIKKEDGEFQWPTINGDSGHKSNTLFINCPFSPSISIAVDQDLNTSNLGHSIYSNGNKKFSSSKEVSCGTVFEDGSMEDEGIITSAYEDDILEESDCDDYLEDLDEDSGGYSSHPNQMRQIHLVRHFRFGLGISIKGGSDFSLPVIIAGIRPDTPASTSGLIFVGDQLVSVNGVPIDETTSHHDALRLLSECGDQVCIVVRHCNAVSTFRKRWRRRDRFGCSVGARNSTQNSMPDLIGSLNGSDSKTYEHSSPTAATNYRRSNLSRSMTSLSHYLRIDLFQAGLSQYISYSDKLRDSSFEVFTSDGNALVIQCSNEDICYEWCHAIKSTIDNLTDSFIQYFNKHFPQREHIFYMGWVSECLSNDPPIALKHSLGYRWLNRYLIIKGGNAYLFKTPPTAILHGIKHKIANISRRNQNGSSGSSLGSVGSSGSDASNSSSSTHALSASNLINGPSSSTDLSYKLKKSKPDRLMRLNKEFDNELSNCSMSYFTCYKSDFRCIKTNELPDEKKHCFVICNGTLRQKYYSTENESDLKRLQHSWTRANYQSVIKLKNKAFSVVLEEENIFGSLTLDWRYGFSFYNPKTKQYLWSYKFYQLKNSSDDGKKRLHLTFVTDPNDSRVSKRHVLQCSCLQTLIYSIHAFLSAKVYSLHI